MVCAVTLHYLTMEVLRKITSSSIICQPQHSLAILELQFPSLWDLLTVIGTPHYLQPSHSPHGNQNPSPYLSSFTAPFYLDFSNRYHSTLLSWWSLGSLQARHLTLTTFSHWKIETNTMPCHSFLPINVLWQVLLIDLTAHIWYIPEW